MMSEDECGEVSPIVGGKTAKKAKATPAVPVEVVPVQVPPPPADSQIFSSPASDCNADNSSPGDTCVPDGGICTSGNRANCEGNRNSNPPKIAECCSCTSLSPSSCGRSIWYCGPTCPSTSVPSSEPSLSTTSPSKSQVPTLELEPSASPSTSTQPSSEPSSRPSAASGLSTSSPSTSTSSQPSTSAQPSSSKSSKGSNSKSGKSSKCRSGKASKSSTATTRFLRLRYLG